MYSPFFIDAGGVTFPVELLVDIHPTGNVPTSQDAERNSATPAGSTEAPKYFKKRTGESIDDMARRLFREVPRN